LEIPNATVAIFSKLKYVNAPNFSDFRKGWNAKFRDGFIVHSKAFDGLTGDFPIGFLIWDIDQNSIEKIAFSKIQVEVLNKNAQPIGTKAFSNIESSLLLGDWIKRPRPNGTLAVPLSNAITPAKGTRDVRGT